MKKKFLIAAFGSLMALSFGTTYADSDERSRGYQNGHPQNYQRDQHRSHPPKPYVIRHRLADQERAIYDGIRNGSITKKESRILKHNIAKIKTEYQRAKDDDEYISMRERERLDHMLDRNERMIRKLEGKGVQPF